MTESRFLTLLKEEQSKYALLALKQPNQRDAFEYGYRVGMIAGLEQAIAVLLKGIEEENSRDL